MGKYIDVLHRVQLGLRRMRAHALIRPTRVYAAALRRKQNPTTPANLTQIRFTMPLGNQHLANLLRRLRQILGVSAARMVKTQIPH